MNMRYLPILSNQLTYGGFCTEDYSYDMPSKPSHVAELTKDHVLGKKVLFGHPFNPPTYGNPWCLNKNLQ